MGNVNEPGTAVADGRDGAAAEDLAAQNTTNSTMSALMSSGALSVLKTAWVSSESHTASPDVSLNSANVSLPIPEAAIPESFDDGRILLPVNSPNRPLKDIAIQSEHANASEPSVDQDEPLSTYALIVDRLLSSSSSGTHPVAADDVQRNFASPSSRGLTTIPVKTDTIDNRLSATDVGSRPTINAAQKSSAVSSSSDLVPTFTPANDMELVPAEEGMSSTVPTSSSSSVTASRMQNNSCTNDIPSTHSAVVPTLPSSISNVRLTADIPGAQIIPSVPIGVDQETADALPESSLILSDETLPSTTDSGTTLTDLSLSLPTGDDIVQKVAISGEVETEPLNLASQLRHHANPDDDMATILLRYPELSMVPKFTSYVEATNLAARYPELAHIILSHPLAVKKASVPSDQSRQSPRPNWALAPPDDDTSKHTASRPNWAHAPPDDDTLKHTASRPNWALAPASPPKAPSRRNYIPLPSEDSPEQSAQVVPVPALRHDGSKHTPDRSDPTSLSGNAVDGPKHTPDRPNWALASSDPPRQPSLSGNAVDGPKHTPGRPNWALAGPDSPKQSTVINALNGPKHTPDRPNWALADPDPPRQPNPHISDAFDGPKHTPERPNWALAVAGSDPSRQQRNSDQSERRGRDRERRRGYAGYDAGAMYNDGYGTRAQNFADQQWPNNMASTTRTGSYADQQWNSSPHTTVESPWESSLAQDNWNTRNRPDEQINWNNAFVGDAYPNDEPEWFRNDNQLQADPAWQAPVHRRGEHTRNDRYQPPVEDSWNASGARSQWNAERPRNHRRGYQSHNDMQDPWSAPAPHSNWNTNLGSRAERPNMGRHQQEIPWNTTTFQSPPERNTSTDDQRSGREDAYLRFRESGPDRGPRERPPHDPPPRIPWQTSNTPDARFALRQIDRAGVPIPRRHDNILEGNVPTGSPYGQHWKEPNNPEWVPQAMPPEPRNDKRDNWNAWTPDHVDDNWKRLPAQNQGNTTGTARREPGNDEMTSHNWSPKVKPQALSDGDVWNRPLDGAIDDWLGPAAGSTRPVEQPVQNEWDAPRQSQVAKDDVSWNNEVTHPTWSSGPQPEASQAFDDLWNRPLDGNPEDWVSPTVREDGAPGAFSSANGKSVRNGTRSDINKGDRDWQDRVGDQDLMDSTWGVTVQSTTSGVNQDPWTLTTSADDWLTPSSQSEASQPTMEYASVCIPVDSPLWSTPPQDPQIDEWAAKQTAIILESNAISIVTLSQEHCVTDTAANLTKNSAPASLSQNQRGDNVAPFTSNAAVAENWIIPGSVPAEVPVPEAQPAHLPLLPMLDRADSLNASAPYQEVNVLAVPGTGVDQDNAAVAQGFELGTVAEQSKQDTTTGENKDAVPEADTRDKKSATFLKGKSTVEGGKQKTGIADASTNWRARDASSSPKYLPPSARRFYSPKREPSVSRPGREGSPFQTKRTEQSVERSDYSSLLRQTAEAAPDVSTISQQGVATVAAMKASELFNKGKENIPAVCDPVPNSTSGEWTVIGAKPNLPMQPVESKNVEELAAELKHPNAFSGLSVDVEGPVIQNDQF